MKHIAGQTDTQQFCYDQLSRLTWSGTNGTPACSGTSITAGTLTAAQYQQSNNYNVDGGLTSGPAGSYTYGDSTHPHAVTTTSSGYSAAYDAAGNLICRATSNAATCSGSSVTGQQLSYDAEGRLTGWQDQPTSPTQTVNYLYDGSGNRVAMQSTANGTTTLTSYIGSIEEVQTSGTTTQTTTFYSVGGKRIAANVNGTFYYFGYDALGSQVAVLDANGNLAGAQLYGPYGSSRYHTGTIPTSIGFTGQRADSVTGLDYYNARYYDPTVGQFLSADSVQGNIQGMDPYAYVGGNPESRTDPTGQRFACGDGPGEDCGGSGGSSGTGTSPGENRDSGTGTSPGENRDSSSSSTGLSKESGGPPSHQSNQPAKKKTIPWQPRPGDAQQAAYKAFRNFFIAAAGFAATGIVLHALAGILLLASIPEWLTAILAPLGLSTDVLAAHIEALARAAGFLGAEATLLSGLFAFQANFGSDWWSNRSNVSDFFNGSTGVNTIIEKIGSATAIIAAGLTWFNRFVPAAVIEKIGAGAWFGMLGVTAANAEMFRPWSQEAEHDEFHAMYGD